MDGGLLAPGVPVGAVAVLALVALLVLRSRVVGGGARPRATWDRSGPRSRDGRHSAWYETYLQSPAWAARRRRTLTLAGGVCQRCGRVRASEVHHKSYVRLGFEDDRDLEALCAGCHTAAHGRRSAPRRG